MNNKPKIVEGDPVPIYFPLGGRLEGDSAFIMVSCRGQKHDETMKMFLTLLKENDIKLGEGHFWGDEEDDLEDGLLLAKDYEKFEQVMTEAGWKKQFIAFGP